jgi:hypothetical protein
MLIYMGADTGYLDSFNVDEACQGGRKLRCCISDQSTRAVGSIRVSLYCETVAIMFEHRRLTHVLEGCRKVGVGL